ncbi:MAG: metal-dependent transcriptional regulator [candidate division NC10 bacterium]|nr:metal-dependent transcriptional regulator [candidate division NC10 bacterium]
MTHDIGLMEKTEMYLKAITVLQQSTPPVTTSKVADFLKISVPAASDMLKRLMQKGFVLTETDGGVGVTADGLQIALQVVRRLRVAERFLTDVLGLSLEKVYDEACKFEHVLSGEVEERLIQFLKDPLSCPHGHPIPDGRGRLPFDYPGTTLGELKEGTMATVFCVPEEDPELLLYLAELGLLPHVNLQVKRIAPYHGPIFLRIGDMEQAIGRDVAARIYVTPT